MRTTLTIDDELLRLAKERAARAGKTVSQVVEDAIRQSLTPVRDRARTPITLVVDSGDGLGLGPGVDLDDSAALLDLMAEDG